MEIRPASPADAEDIARVYVEARRTGYRGFFPDAYLDALSTAEFAPIWRLRLSEPATRSLAAIEGGVVVGHVRFGPAGSAAVAGEVLQLHVLPDSWRRSAGSALLAAAEQALAEAGYRQAVLWVYEANLRARLFYESRGWSPDGAASDADFGGFSVRQVRYRKQLVAPA